MVLARSLHFERGKFVVKASFALRSFFVIIKILLMIIFRNDAVFHPPSGWLDPIANVISLPFAPKGKAALEANVGRGG